MERHFPPTREELYNVQMDVKHVQAVQNEHADRLLRLEKRQADDAALKSVWNSPFPSVLGGTPQQGKFSADVAGVNMQADISLTQALSTHHPPRYLVTLMMIMAKISWGASNLMQKRSLSDVGHHELIVFGLISAHYMAQTGLRDLDHLATLGQSARVAVWGVTR